MNERELFEQYLIQRGYAEKKSGYLEHLLGKYTNPDFMRKKEEFENNLISWYTKYTQTIRVEPPIGFFLEIRLYDFLYTLDPIFIPETGTETADIQISSNSSTFQIECTHSTLENIHEFYKKTTIHLTGDLDEKNLSRSFDNAIGVEDPIFLHWRVCENLSKKAYKKIDTPFVIYFWYPPICRIDNTDFKDIINFPYQRIASFNRKKWAELEQLLLQLETDNVLRTYEKASEDLDEDIRKKFYEIIEKNAESNLKQYNSIKEIGGNLDLYRRNLNFEQMKEVIVNTIIFKYKIQTSPNFLGLIVDNAKLDEKPKLRFIPFKMKNCEFEGFKNLLLEKLSSTQVDI
ncbi:MAG: hypothetical protein ACTSP3_01680 [Candidatus Heimdallarchaeaceae archaeon]